MENSQTRMLTLMALSALLCAFGIFIAEPASAACVDDLTYTISNGKVTITDCDTTAPGSLEIPATIGSYPVTSIGNFAFQSCSNLTNVTVPNSVTSIGSFAFQSCYALKTVTIPDSVISIGSNAFQSCDSLTDNDLLQDAVPYKDGLSNLLKYAFNMNLAGADNRTIVPDGASGLPAGGLVVGCDNSIYWRVQYVRRRFSELRYTPQKSGDLTSGSFQPLTGLETVEVIDGDWERVTVDEPYDPSTTPSCFSRVNVETTP